MLLSLSLLASALAGPSDTIAVNVINYPESDISLSILGSLLLTPAYANITAALNGTGNYTLFAPSDGAFAAAIDDGLNTNDTSLINAVLLYHTLSLTVYSNELVALQFPDTLLNSSPYVLLGGAYQVVSVANNSGLVTTNWGISTNASQTATVLVADIESSNGVIHIIDNVEIPPTDIVDQAVSYGLTTLLAAVVAADLDGAVTLPSLTIFAPTNEAFANAGLNISALTQDQLTAILELHVVASVAYSTQLSQGQKIPTLAGSSLTVNIASNGSVQFVGPKNTATVVTPNILVSNGVIHVIDTVLVPGSGAAAGCSLLLVVASLLVTTFNL